MDEDELTDAERFALSGLPTESALPPGLEDRVVEALRTRGLVAGPDQAPAERRRSWRWPAAAAAAFFCAGVATGLAVRASGPPTGARGAAFPEPTYLLLLYPGPSYVAGSAADEAARVAEYGAWAGRLKREGRLLGAEKLGDQALVLEGKGPGARGEGPQGYFIVQARTLDEARAIARDCPHLAHGGKVTVQVVDPT